MHAAHVLRRDKHGNDIANAVGEVAAQPTVVIIFDQTRQAAMANASNSHESMYGNAGRVSRKMSIHPIR